MVLQYAAVFACIAVALAYVGRSVWRTWNPPAGSNCGGGCGCAKPKEAPPRLTLGIERLEGRVTR